ncbi:MAG: ribonuclease P protein component [Ruminococcus sp.]|nr:ribonuclease P protein component [Ruminococcus sp.]
MLYTVRIKDNRDFTRLYGKGVFVSCGICTVYFRKNGRNFNRIGISTGKKIGNAVKRSRARRVIRQAYRECEKDFPRGFDIVVAARDRSTECKTGDIVSFFEGRVIPKMRDPYAKRTVKKNDDKGKDRRSG